MSGSQGSWEKKKLVLENGTTAENVQFPVIVSASRSTDIPAFYCDWFFHRLEKGYSAWVNPYNNVQSYVAYGNTRFIVFWSKNPRPLLKHLPVLQRKGIGCYVQYTLNDYEAEGLEKGVPPLDYRIETFRELSSALGRNGVIWRFDPLMLTDDISIDALLNKIESIGASLKDYTEKLVFSFADISGYRKVKKNLDDDHIPYHEWTREQMIEFAGRLVELNRSKGWHYRLATCGETVNLEGVEHNHCVDDVLMIKRASHDKVLMDFLKAKFAQMPAPDLFGNMPALPEDALVMGDGRYATRGNNKDKGQREFCGCMKAKDIGQYNTCPHLCKYCYANSSASIAVRNWQRHQAAPLSEMIIGVEE